MNHHLHSNSNPRFWAAGDCASTDGPPLTPVATLEGEIVAHNLLEDELRKPNYDAIPSVLFFIPPVTRVGMSESQAEKEDVDYTVKQGDTSDWFSSSHQGVEHSYFKTLVEKNTGQVLGAHIMGPEAQEVINVFAAAIRFGITAEELTRTPWAYPTATSDITYML